MAVSAPRIVLASLASLALLGFIAGTPVHALDSTQSIPPKVGWNKPSAKRADYAEEANKAKSAESATTAGTAGTAAKVDASALSNLPSCSSGQVLTVSNGALSCATVSSSGGGGSSCSGVFSSCVTRCPTASWVDTTGCVTVEGPIGSYCWQDCGGGG